MKGFLGCLPAIGPNHKFLGHDERRLAGMIHTVVPAGIIEGLTEHLSRHAVMLTDFRRFPASWTSWPIAAHHLTVTAPLPLMPSNLLFRHRSP